MSGREDKKVVGNGSDVRKERNRCHEIILLRRTWASRGCQKVDGKRKYEQHAVCMVKVQSPRISPIPRNRHTDFAPRCFALLCFSGRIR
jgi:hypothetical protein